VLRLGETRNAYRILVMKPLERVRDIDNIKIDRRKISC